MLPLKVLGLIAAALGYGYLYERGWLTVITKSGGKYSLVGFAKNDGSPEIYGSDERYQRGAAQGSTVCVDLCTGVLVDSFLCRQDDDPADLGIPTVQESCPGAITEGP